MFWHNSVDFVRTRMVGDSGLVAGHPVGALGPGGHPLGWSGSGERLRRFIIKQHFRFFEECEHYVWSAVDGCYGRLLVEGGACPRRP